MATIECSCKLCPTPGIYAVTSMPFVSRTRANFLKAGFGFLGVIVPTFIATPLLNGDGYGFGLFFKTLNPRAKAGDLVFALAVLRGCFINCRNVGMTLFLNEASNSDCDAELLETRHPLL